MRSHLPLIGILCLVLLAVSVHSARYVLSQPNIVIFMGDDIGNADFELVDQAMSTPALTRLEQQGLLLNQSYTLQTCTPTRTALLTGRYPYKLGLQVGKIKGTARRWLDVNQTLLPASLKKLDYETHAVGKWHLGFCNWRLTPMYRGFDTFYGFLSGAQGYFNHSGSSASTFDFRDNERIAWETKGNYSTELHTTRVQKIIKKRHRQNKKEVDKKPFFIYMAYQNAHSPFEVKQRYVDKYCSHVLNKTRQTHCAMVAAMDESIGNITKTLEDLKILDNTIILYLSDNGAALGDGGYNWPMRGGKSSFWEGGTRSRTIFFYPKKVKKPGTTWGSLIHVTDWYPTLYAAAGGDPAKLQEMDGINQYYKLIRGKKGLRRRMVYNIDTREGYNRSAVRIGNMKLLTGHPARSDNNSAWLAPPDMEAAGTAQSEFVVRPIPDKQLFNVKKDPRESKNLYGRPYYARIQAELEQMLKNESEKVIAFPEDIEKEPLGNPDFYGGAWSPGWCCP